MLFLVTCLFKFCSKSHSRLLVSPECNLEINELFYVDWIISCKLIENPQHPPLFPAPTSSVNCYFEGKIVSEDRQAQRGTCCQPPRPAPYLWSSTSCSLAHHRRTGRAVSLWVHFFAGDPCDHEWYWNWRALKSCLLRVLNMSQDSLAYVGPAALLKRAQNLVGSWRRM